MSFRTGDPNFDASYRITIDVPDGYYGLPHLGPPAKIGRIGQMAVGAWVIGDVFADPCRSETTRLSTRRRSLPSSVDALVAALAGQKGVRVSTPTDITVDGFAEYVHEADRALRNQTSPTATPASS